MQAYIPDIVRRAGTLVGATDSHGSPTEISACWASDDGELRAAQRLRYQVFVGEMGASHQTQVGAGDRFESDRFDPYCDHLLIKVCHPWSGSSNRVIGTTRVLRPVQAERAGGYYSDTAFDLRAIDALRPHALEMGRTCVHPDWRNGTVIMTMWRALGQFMAAHQLDSLLGSASISLNDAGYSAAVIWQRLRGAHLAAAAWQVCPRDPLPIEQLLAQPSSDTSVAPIITPPLINGYLRCGAQLLGPPARDVLFNTADLPMMLRLDDLTPRYRKHFLGL